MARALGEAHQQGDVPDLLTRIQYRPQLEALLALETWLTLPQVPEKPPLAAQHAKRLASARIQPTQWEEAISALTGLLPVSDAREELLFDLSLSRLAKHGSFDGLDAPRDALVKLLDLADLREGQSVLVSCFDAGLLAQTLAEEYPTILATVAGEERPGVLPRLFPTLHLDEEPDLLNQPQPFQRVLVRLEPGMHFRDNEPTDG